MSGRIYSNGSILGGLLSGGYEGYKDAQDEKFRRAELMDRANARVLNSPYSVKDVKGLPGGYEVKPETRDASNEYLAKIAPQFYEKKIKEPVPEVPSRVVDPYGEMDDETRAKIDSERLRKGLPILGAPEKNQAAPTQNQQPPQQAPQIKPILKSPKLKQEEMRMDQKKILVDGTPMDASVASGNTPTAISDAGVDEQGRKVKVLDTKVQGSGLDVNVPVTKGTPAQPGVTDRFTPPDWMLSRVGEAATSAQAKDTDPLISLETLPMAAKKLAGLDPEATGSIRSSILKELIQAGAKTSGGGIRPEVQVAIDDVLSGRSTPGAVARIFPDLTPREQSYLNQAARSSQTQGGVQGRFDKVNDRQEKRDRRKIIYQAQKDIFSSVKGELEELDAARKLRKLVSGKTAGSEAMVATMLTRISGQTGNSISDRDLKAQAGLSGWENIVNQMVAKAQGEGLTKENIARVINLASTFEEAAKKVIMAKTAFARRSALSQLQDFYDDPRQAEIEFNKAISPDELLKGFSDEPSPSGGGQKSSGLKSSEPSPKQQKDFMELSRMTTSKLREIEARSISKEEKERKKQLVKDRYKQITGIDWGK